MTDAKGKCEMRYMSVVVCLGLLSSCTGPVGLRDHAVFDAAALDGEGKNALNHALASGQTRVTEYLRGDLGLSPSTNTTKIGLSPAGHSMEGVSSPGARDTDRLIDQIDIKQIPPADTDKPRR